MRLLLVLLVMLTVNGCRFVTLKEPYLQAKSSSKLEIPSGLDKPNTSSSLSIPSADTSVTFSENLDDTPPEMPIRKRQSGDGKLKIENENGYAVLIVPTTKSAMYDVMTKLDINNWSVVSSNEDECKVNLKYIDLAAKERKETGFFKRMFSRKDFHSDYSGEYLLSCSESGSLTKVKFSKADSQLPKSFLADSVMNNLYSFFEQ